MTESTAPQTPPQEQPQAGQVQSVTRFSLSQRLEHIIMLTAFTLLGLTGLPQKYASSSFGEFIIGAFGGIEGIRLVHRIAAVVLMIISIYHIIAVLYRILVLRSRLDMLPLFDDFKHLLHDLQYYAGLRKHKAYYGRYNYAEKAEYLAVVWGTVLMAITGFMMWNPIATANVLPGETIPAAKAAHGGEAVLAVLAIIIWHMYHVHIKMFNKSMFTGKMTRHEMEEEHPAELAMIEEGRQAAPPPPDLLRQRQKVFYPAAGVLVVIFTIGLVGFVSFEKSAITTIPRVEPVQVFVPITPTPRPLPTLTPTPDPNAPVGANTWDGTWKEIFRNRCGTCHVIANVGGLNLDTYQTALQGGTNGPGIVPNDPNGSQVVTIQQAGGHPGQLTTDELNKLIEWITSGAPER